MKKILSLTLAALMVVSMVPTAFAADVDYQNGTEVEYTGSRTTVNADGTETHNAEYTITVPALLAPGGSGTVTLQGMWPSDATVKVTAEDKVEMVNNINSADKKTLAVTFTAIELAGNNTVAVSDDETVSVADISNALFGTWAGKFNYNVEYNGEAGGSGTVTPTPDPDDNNLLSFTLDGTEYKYENGMTWAQWIDSDYNTTPDAYTYDATYVYNADGKKLNYLRGWNAFSLTSSETIKESHRDFTWVGEATPEANLITFTIDGKEYQAEEGMTWEQWMNSEYEDENFQPLFINSNNGAGLTSVVVGNMEETAFVAFASDPNTPIDCKSAIDATNYVLSASGTGDYVIQ